MVNKQQCQPLIASIAMQPATLLVRSSDCSAFFALRCGVTEEWGNVTLLTTRAIPGNEVQKIDILAFVCQANLKNVPTFRALDGPCKPVFGHRLIIGGLTHGSYSFFDGIYKKISLRGLVLSIPEIMYFCSHFMMKMWKVDSYASCISLCLLL